MIFHGTMVLDSRCVSNHSERCFVKGGKVGSGRGHEGEGQSNRGMVLDVAPHLWTRYLHLYTKTSKHFRRSYAREKEKLRSHECTRTKDYTSSGKSKGQRSLHLKMLSKICGSCFTFAVNVFYADGLKFSWSLLRSGGR